MFEIREHKFLFSLVRDFCPVVHTVILKRSEVTSEEESG